MKKKCIICKKRKLMTRNVCRHCYTAIHKIKVSDARRMAMNRIRNKELNTGKTIIMYE